MPKNILDFKETHNWQYFQKVIGEDAENYAFFDRQSLLPTNDSNYTEDNVNKLFSYLSESGSRVYTFTILEKGTEKILKEGFIINGGELYENSDYCSLSYDYNEHNNNLNSIPHLSCSNIVNIPAINNFNTDPPSHYNDNGPTDGFIFSFSTNEDKWYREWYTKCMYDDKSQIRCDYNAQYSHNQSIEIDEIEYYSRTSYIVPIFSDDRYIIQPEYENINEILLIEKYAEVI